MARPEHEPTEDLKRRVAVSAGGGMTHEEIALGLDIDRGTLEKHYARELSVGAYERRMEALDALHVASLKGNVTAIREYLSRTPQVAAPPAAPDLADPQPKLGKKDQANADARTAGVGTDWDQLLKPSARPN